MNTPNGEKEVFILTDRMTCYVPKGELAQNSVKAISRRITAGTAGPMAMPGRTDSTSLPDYQKGGYKALPEKTASDGEPKEENKNIPVKPVPKWSASSVPELRGIPELSDVMDIQRSSGLNMFQKIGSAQRSASPGGQIDYVFRKYGYDTNIRKDQLNLEEEGGDIIDREVLGLDDLTDDELFLLVMKGKINGIGLNQGAQNMLAMGLSPIPEGEIEGKAVALLKERKGIKSE